MAFKVTPRVGKALYAVLFTVALPLLLAGWAAAADDVVGIPAPRSMPLGLALACAGIALMLLGTRALRVHGHGLPMSPYPPSEYVTQGVYRICPHPIYTGFSAVCVGLSIAAGSAGGLWLVSPVVMLSCAAFVLGFERPVLRRRFGEETGRSAVLAKDDPDARPSAEQRAACYLLVLLPFLALYLGVLACVVPPDAVVSYFPFELDWPVLEWTQPVYLSAYAAVLLAPLVAKSARDLRRFEIRTLLAMALAFPLFFALPIITPPRGIWRWQPASSPAAAIPAFQVLWAFIAAEVYAARQTRLRWIWRGWALAVTVSCVTAGMHSIAGVAAGLAACALVVQSQRLWDGIRRPAERIANSWREWRWGPVRLINHGLWAGLAVFAGLAIMGVVAGPGHEAALILATLASLAGAGVWAQTIEGSPALLRPYGYYGGLLGAVLGALCAPLFKTDTWLVLGAFSVAGPWIQAVGRLRCLVQGCCHGRPAAANAGIRYVHPQSRVCRLAGWSGVPVHPTPLYSILWNVVVAMAVARLWSLGAPLHFIAGAYLILTGLGRFVEESYRGEPQTPVAAGLRLYQWMAIATLTVGAVLTVAGSGGPAPGPVFHWGALLGAAAIAPMAVFALGVDFPESSRRFSRLA